MAKVAVVTGGSRGIGAATAMVLAERGWDVGVGYRADAEAAGVVVARCQSMGVRAVAVAADVSRETQVVGFFESVDAALGPLAALVNSAGVVDSPVRVAEMTSERLERMFAVNVIGSFLCAREALRRMSTVRGGRGGAIVNVSSAASRLGSPGEWVDYAASKGAIDSMTLGLAREVADEGIRVTRCGPASSPPTSTPVAASPTASHAWPRLSRCGAAATPSRWPTPSPGSARTRPPM